MKIGVILRPQNVKHCTVRVCDISILKVYSGQKNESAKTILAV